MDSNGKTLQRIAEALEVIAMHMAHMEHLMGVADALEQMAPPPRPKQPNGGTWKPPIE